MKRKRKSNPDRNPTKEQGPIREPERREEMVLERGKEDEIFFEGGSDEDLSESGERPDLWDDDLERRRGKSGMNRKTSRASPEKCA